MMQDIVKRRQDLQKLHLLLHTFPVTAILGPRQVGKTVLSQEIQADYYFDLENPRDLQKLAQAQTTLENLQGLIVIDEIQRLSNLFPLLRYLVDSNDQQQYLILGSASRDLMQQSSESLAGRIGYYYLNGFSLDDIGYSHQQALWMKGSYPRSYLASNHQQSLLWRQNYIATFLERDIPQLGINIPANTLRRFLDYVMSLSWSSY